MELLLQQSCGAASSAPEQTRRGSSNVKQLGHILTPRSRGFLLQMWVVWVLLILKLGEAEPLYRDALDGRPRVFDDFHPSSLRFIHRLANFSAATSATRRLLPGIPQPCAPAFNQMLIYTGALVHVCIERDGLVGLVLLPVLDVPLLVTLPASFKAKLPSAFRFVGGRPQNCIQPPLPPIQTPHPPHTHQRGYVCGGVVLPPNLLCAAAHIPGAHAGGHGVARAPGFACI